MKNIDPAQIRHVHLVAICGAGMGSLAGMLKAKGLYVTGSDQNVYPPMSDQLDALGIPIMQGYLPEHLEPRPDLIVIGNVISKGNPEGDAAIASGVPYVSMPEALRLFFFNERTTVAVCGTHGKTTTTALASWIATTARLDPTYLVGGVLVNTDASYHVGQGRLAIVEGDEYDTAWFDKIAKFVRYRPDIAILGNVEFDHADIYPDFAAVRHAFSLLVESLPPEGLLIAGIDCPTVNELCAGAKCRVVTYAVDRPADWTGKIESMYSDRMTSRVFARGTEYGLFETQIVGGYNLKNILATLVLADHLGLPLADVQQGLATFAGVKRRQQVRGEAAGVLVIDDFGHHPTAVRVTLESLRVARPGRRVIAVFEPRSNTSRRNIFQTEYAQAFGGADVVILCEVFAKGGTLPADKLDVERLVRELAGQGKDARYAPDYDTASTQLRELMRPGDQVVFLSNGGFGGLPQKTIDYLRGLERR